jgi:subtilisin family serine protease
MIIEIESNYRDYLIKYFRGQSLIPDRMDIFNLTAQFSQSITLDRLRISFIPAIGSLSWIEGLIEELPINYVSENRKLEAQQYLPTNDDILIRNPTEFYIKREDIIPSSVVKKKIGIKEGVTGKYSKIAVLDTGAGRNRQYNLATIEAQTSNRFTLALRDASGHGVHVSTLAMGKAVDLGSGIVIEGMAPNASLLSGKCLFGAMGMGSDWGFMQMLVAAMQSGAHIINGSLGSENETDRDSAIYKTMKEIDMMGVKQCYAAGNSGEGAKVDSINSPGDVDFAITVGSNSITDGKRSFFSSIGGSIKKPDIMAFGGGRSSSESDPDENILSSSSGAISKMNGGYKLGAIKGTSQATPEVTGTLAAWDEVFYEREHRFLKSSEIKKIFRENGHSWNRNEGHGEIDFYWIYNYMR